MWYKVMEIFFVEGNSWSQISTFSSSMKLVPCYKILGIEWESLFWEIGMDVHLLPKMEEKKELQ